MEQTLRFTDRCYLAKARNSQFACLIERQLMPKPGKRTSVIMYAELVAILALTAVLNWRNSQQNAELSAHLIADNATRLRQEDEEAKILLAGYVQSKAPLLK